MRSTHLIAALAALGFACNAPELPPSPRWHVADLALSVDPEGGGVLLAHVRRCDEDCDGETDLEIAAVDPTTETEAAVRNPLYSDSSGQGDNPLFEGRNETLMGGAAGGGVHWFAFADAAEVLHAVSVEPTAGTPVAAAQHIPSSLLRQTPSSTFGTMVRGGQLSVTAEGTLLLVGRDADGDGLAMSSILPDGTERSSAPFPVEATVAVLSAVGGAHATATEAETPEGVTTVQLEGLAPQTAPETGLPAALWTDGKLFRVALKKADSVAALWDGERLLRVPRSDEAACTALSFDAAGALYMLHAGPRSSVLYGQRDGGPMEVLALLSVRDEAGPQTRGCALSISSEGRAHVAWVEGESVIAYEEWDLRTLTSVLKTRHETAKNSVSNVR